jgi:hypothetical protein
MMFVFSVEMVNPFSFAHLDTVFSPYVVVARTSAFFGVLLLVPLHISVFASRMRVTLSTAPCTTPFLISLGVEYMLTMATYSVRFIMNEWVNFSIFPSIFQFFSFRIIMSYDM